jgi:hypothetical protein
MERYQSASKEIKSVRSSYYMLPDKYNDVVMRDAKAATQNADLVNKLTDYEGMINKLRKSLLKIRSKAVYACQPVHTYYPL